MTNNVTGKTKTVPKKKAAPRSKRPAASEVSADEQAPDDKKPSARALARAASQQRAVERKKARDAREKALKKEREAKVKERQKAAAMRLRAAERERAAARRKRAAEREKAAEGRRSARSAAELSMTSSGRRRLVRTMMLESSSKPVDLSLPPDERPLTGIDIEMWRQGLDLNLHKTSYALGIPSPNHYAKLAHTRAPLPMGLEILIRLYGIDSDPPPWHAPSMHKLYKEYYGRWVADVVSKHGEDLLSSARIRAYSRFAALFGRSPYTSYRWIDQARAESDKDDDAEGGQDNRPDETKVKPDVERIAGKISKMSNGKAVLEKLSAKVWKLRGMDFETLFPLKLDV